MNATQIKIKRVRVETRDIPALIMIQNLVGLPSPSELVAPDSPHQLSALASKHGPDDQLCRNKKTNAFAHKLE